MPDRKNVPDRTTEGVELGRGGEYVGQIFRVAVAPDARRAGVGHALIGHADRIFAERDAASVRITVPAGDEGARNFFGSIGFVPQALTMERLL